jgi:hypothetical protein
MQKIQSLFWAEKVKVSFGLTVCEQKYILKYGMFLALARLLGILEL